MRVALLAPMFQDGDAVGNDILGMCGALRNVGIPARVFAHQWSDNLSWLSSPLSDYPDWAATDECLTIYHHATHWQSGWDILRHAGGVKIVRYHCITPSHFFSPYSLDYELSTNLGGELTATMVESGEVTFFLAASEFNLAELRALGLPNEKGGALPPFHNLSALDDVDASMPILTRFLDESINLLFVGRVAPNKGHRHLIHVVNAYRNLFDSHIRLFIVGDLDPRLESYYKELRLHISRLGVDGAVRFEGKVSLSALKAYYLVSHALLVMSEHEGFCVPILEAAHYRLPVLAYASTGIPETLGPNGLLFHQLDYEMFAAAIHTLYTEKASAEWIAEQQTQRLKSTFDRTIIEARFLDYLSPFLR